MKTSQEEGMSSNLKIRPFRKEDQAAVKSLILEGLREHWGTLDASLNPDLNDIATRYAGETFLIAMLDEEIIATGALLRQNEQTGEIVRMSVRTAYRRQGIGSKMLDALVEQAKSSGINRIVLETTSTWEEAISFYLRYGFQITHYKDGNTYFMLQLG